MLWSNAREHQGVIYKVQNNRYDNTVRVLCNPEHADAVKEFCTGIVDYYDKDKCVPIGRVINEKKVIVGIPYYEFESDLKYDDPCYDEDIDQAIDYWLGVKEV